LCSADQDFKTVLHYSADRTKLYGHPAINTIDFDEVTFQMCNRVFVESNMQCLVAHEKYMENWPRPGTDWDTLTSANLPHCISSCNAEAGTDHELLREADHRPPNLQRDGDFAFCYKHVSDCTRKCQEDFSKEMDDFQKKRKD
jgi:hypothetical protein